MELIKKGRSFSKILSQNSKFKYLYKMRKGVYLIQEEYLIHKMRILYRKIKFKYKI